MRDLPASTVSPHGGFVTLFRKELLRFWKVSFQTIASPVLNALLYLLIFSHVLESRVTVFGGQVRYTEFLIPGLVMMSVLQNSFANASSSAPASSPSRWLSSRRLPRSRIRCGRRPLRSSAAAFSRHSGSSPACRPTSSTRSRRSRTSSSCR